MTEGFVAILPEVGILLAFAAVFLVIATSQVSI